VLVDGLGNPLDFILTGGEVGDNLQAIPLLTEIEAGEVLADRGYDSDEPIDFIENVVGATATIPPKKNRLVKREIDYYKYKERHLVECFIGKIKNFRRVFSRFDKYAKRFLSFIHFASICIWLK